MSDTTPGWQPDPTGTHDHRYWDGARWTDNVSDGGVASTDPYVAEATATDPTMVDAPAVAAGDTGPTQPTPGVPSHGPTVAWPSTGAAAAPPPYVPPSPVSGGDGSGGSKKGLLIGGGILAVVALAVGAFLLLGGDDGDSPRTQLAARIRAEADGELNQAQSECVAGYFADAIGDDELGRIDFDADEPPAAFLEAFEELDLVELAEDCELDPDTFGAGSTDDGDDGSGEGESYGDDPELDALYDDCEAGDLSACDTLYLDSPFGSEYEEFGSTCGGQAEEQFGNCESSDGGGNGSSGGSTDGSELPDDFEEILADTYESSLGLSRDKAECLAGRLSEVIESGEIDESEAVSEIFSYLADCDISASEIGAN